MWSARAPSLAKAAYLAKMPHAVVLRSTAGAIRILVTNADVTRLRDDRSSRTTEATVKSA